VPDKLPPEVIEHWPEIFKDIEIKAVPLDYITAVIIHFEDGQTWQIDLDDEKLQVEGADVAEVVEEILEGFFEEYDEYITSVDFKLNTEKVVKDIKKRVQYFLKKRK
jgi:DNA polymerase III sliding clamp (beta) subunit (PCNA family)